MEIKKVEGIIVRDVNYSETSKILTILTKDLGILNVLAKGCRNIKNPLRGVSGKLTYGYFYINYKPSGLSILKTVDVINSLSQLIMDIEKISYASYLLELTEQVLKENNDEKIFDLLKDTLIKINEGFSPSLLTNILELQYLPFLGVHPYIDGCVFCGSQKKIKTISIDNGGYICCNCYRGERLYSDKLIQLLRLLFKIDISKITKLDIKDSLQKELDQLITEYYDQYTGLYLHSKKFLKNLKKIG